MSKLIHKVEQQSGVSIHREIPAMRDSKDFDTSQISERTRTAWKKICVGGNAAVEDYKHVLASIMGSNVVDEILK
ncbi:hypothetical protein [Desulfovibrio sp. UCD-KL4C]|uniref:hypothetical protein n=1 Tax=Desulfovibrio sp. UCD-KL4C TaxID=2578120 RepID=UPI0025C2532A|nr:hypothetical protein [Desulfovibrio sp. UCD-KL4C]